MNTRNLAYVLHERARRQRYEAALIAYGVVGVILALLGLVLFGGGT